MKFAYRRSNGKPPKWIEIKADCRDDLFKHVEHDQWVYDTDGGGEHNGYFAGQFEGKIHYYKFEQEWYWENWGSDERYVQNSFTFTEVDAKEAMIPSPRDWLDISQTSFPETKKWPPHVG